MLENGRYIFVYYRMEFQMVMERIIILTEEYFKVALSMEFHMVMADLLCLMEITIKDKLNLVEQMDSVLIKLIIHLIKVILKTMFVMEKDNKKGKVIIFQDNINMGRKNQGFINIIITSMMDNL
jgi:hypothetical protein